MRFIIEIELKNNFIKNNKKHLTKKKIKCKIKLLCKKIA